MKMAKKKMDAVSGTLELAENAWGAIAQRKFEEMLERDMGKQIQRSVELQYGFAAKYYGAMMEGKKLSAAETKEFGKKLMEAMKTE